MRWIRTRLLLRSPSLNNKLGDVYDGLFGVALNRPILNQQSVYFAQIPMIAR
ncbi:MAG: hypothetical protein HWQ43_09400 [Nostoc sp. JL31]|uniref:hypothetical protein n=1 Tax=Nostoc sp. JL31 TaxID=2815395 RepID=UPI0025E9825A|nr:hypothetical protein [Nostoc sp. JL31]MBN3889373.1 hypothetical protein [Nostoc sp. JL31]